MRVALTDEYTKWTRARSVPGAWQDGRMWVVDNPDARASAVICRLFPELQDTYPALTILRDSLMEDARPFDRATEFNRHIDAPRVLEQLRSLSCARCDMLPDGSKPDMTPSGVMVDPTCKVCDGTGIGNFFPFQSLDLGYMAAVMRQHDAGEIAWDRGLGKTLGACALIDNLRADRVLVVAPNTSKQVVWEDELRRFCPWLDIRIMPNGSPDRRRKLMQHVKTTTNPLVLIAHYESLALVANERSQRKGWRQYPVWDLTVADESHTLSNPTTQKHRSLMQVPTDMKLSETGSMIQNHPEEWYGRLRWMFPKVYSSKWRDWNNRYLEYWEGDYSKVLIGPMIHRLDAMRNELGVFTVYRRKSDELELPPTQEQTIKLDLNPDQRRAYDELRDSLVTTLDSGEVVSALEPVVLLTRLRQLATGIELLSGRLADSTKLDWTVSRVQDRAQSAFICFSWFKPAARALVERLETAGIPALLCDGDTSHKQRRDRIRAFQAGDGARVFVGTISTLGESVNLHRANEGIFIDQSFNPAQNAQAIDRYNRIGQKSATETTKLVARDTVDEYTLLPNLSNKEALRRMITGGR